MRERHVSLLHVHQHRPAAVRFSPVADVSVKSPTDTRYFVNCTDQPSWKRWSL
ncbi:hypothetical protein ACN28S_54145 [Cystobacter fuscus]